MNPAVVQRHTTLGCGPGDDGSTPSPGTTQYWEDTSVIIPGGLCMLGSVFSIPVFAKDNPEPLLYDVFVDEHWIGSRRTREQVALLTLPIKPPPPQKAEVPRGFWRTVCSCGAGVVIDYPDIPGPKWCSRCQSYWSPKRETVYWYDYRSCIDGSVSEPGIPSP